MQSVQQQNSADTKSWRNSVLISGLFDWLFVLLILSVPGGCAAWNRGADYVKLLAPALAPEQGA